MDRATMSRILSDVTRLAGGEAPTFAVMPIRDWWRLRRGPRWKFPLPERRAFRPMPVRDALVKMMRGTGDLIEPRASSRRAFVPSVFARCYMRYLTLDPWINGRGRVKRRLRALTPPKSDPRRLGG